MSVPVESQLSEVRVGTVLSVAFGYKHPFQCEYGTVVAVSCSDKRVLFLKFPESGLVCGSVLVSDFDEYCGRVVLNPINSGDIDEQDLVVLMEIEAGMKLNEEWDGGLFEVFAMNGEGIKY